MKVDWIGARNKWQLTTTVRYTDDVREVPGVKAERRVAGDDPSRAVWTVPATFSSAYQLAQLFPDAEWSPQAEERRARLGRFRKERIAAKVTGANFDNLMRALEVYEHAETIDDETMREVREALLPVESDRKVLFIPVPGLERRPRGAAEAGPSRGRQEEGEAGGQGRRQIVSQVPRPARAPGGGRANVRSTPTAGRGGTPRERGQEGQQAEQPLGVRQSERARALSPAQVAGVATLLKGNTLFCDDMGSGKSVMSCVAAAMLAPERTLIITTQSTLHVWEDHLREWTGIEPFVFHGAGRAKVLDAFNAYEGRAALITTHTLARKHSSLASYAHVPASGEPGELNVPWDLAIVDEAHRMGMDPTNVGARALHQIARTCSIRWALTGTPINDSPDDLWIAMRFVDEDVLGPRSGFRQRYCIMRNNGFAMENAGFHPDTLDELHKIVDPYILRRMKREVHENLPVPLEPEFIRLDLTAGQAKVYNKLVKDGIAGLPKGQFALAIDDLGLHRLCEYTAQGVPVMRDDDPTRVDHLVGPSNKVDFVLDHLESNHRPVVLYSFSSKVATMLSVALEKAGVPHGMIHGGTPASDRRAQIKAFQANKLRAMIITDAAAEGVTLTAADTVIFIMESWHAPTNQQVRDRIDRFGQDQRPRTIVLISAGTVDESRRLAVTKKINVQQSFLKDKAEVASFLTGTWEV